MSTVCFASLHLHVMYVFHSSAAEVKVSLDKGGYGLVRVRWSSTVKRAGRLRNNLLTLPTAPTIAPTQGEKRTFHLTSGRAELRGLLCLET